jgi:protein-L-isoaspartate(D-aspartate) O-methyltransferase
MDEFYYKRQKMVDNQIVKRGIKDKRVIEAMREIPRHLFVDEAFWDSAYDDTPLPIGEKQTISQPYIVALMTELLGLKGEEKVLEIGTGSGYQAAILSRLAGFIYSIERIPSLAKRARKVLDELGVTNALLRIDDGTKGWEEHAPFDGIIVTAAAPFPPKPLLDQLKDGGRLVIPLGDEYNQDLTLIRKEGERFNSESYGPCRFVRLIGEHGWKE